MKKHAFVLTLGVVLLSVMVSMGMLINAEAHKKSSSVGGGGNGAGAPGQGKQIKAGEYRLSGPFTHRNLSIFLVHGKNLIKSKTFLTLRRRWSRRRLWSMRLKA